MKANNGAWEAVRLLSRLAFLERAGELPAKDPSHRLLRDVQALVREYLCALEEKTLQRGLAQFADGVVSPVWRVLREQLHDELKVETAAEALVSHGVRLGVPITEALARKLITALDSARKRGATERSGRNGGGRARGVKELCRTVVGETFKSWSERTFETAMKTEAGSSGGVIFAEFKWRKYSFEIASRLLNVPAKFANLIARVCEKLALERGTQIELDAAYLDGAVKQTLAELRRRL